MAEVNRLQISEKMQNIVKFEGEDSLTTSVKFGVLIGLIKVDSVSNKEVVNTILQLVSEKAILTLIKSQFLTGKNCNNNSVGEKIHRHIRFFFSFSRRTQKYLCVYLYLSGGEEFVN